MPGDMLEQMLGAQITMPRLAKALAKIVGRTVADKTNITGSYDITLKWRPDETQASNVPAQLTDQASSIFTAIQEQLGLRLESQKGPVEVLVVDSADRATAN